MWCRTSETALLFIVVLCFVVLCSVLCSALVATREDSDESERGKRERGVGTAIASSQGTDGCAVAARASLAEVVSTSKRRAGICLAFFTFSLFSFFFFFFPSSSFFLRDFFGPGRPLIYFLLLSPP